MWLQFGFFFVCLFCIKTLDSFQGNVSFLINVLVIIILIVNGWMETNGYLKNQEVDIWVDIFTQSYL